MNLTLSHKLICYTEFLENIMDINKNSTFQKQLYLFYTEDGLIDLAIGSVILLFGVLLLVDLSWVIAVIELIPLLLWFLAKERITRNRTGIINPSPSMKKRFSTFYITLIAFGLLILILLVLSISTDLDKVNHYPLSMFGLILAMGVSGLALMLQTNRFFIHAAILFIAMSMGEIINPLFPNIDTFLFAVISAGALILIIGSFTFIRFLKKYPPMIHGAIQ
jgi:hypothetical protein